MTFADLDGFQFFLLALGAAGIGVSKSGFPGVSMLHVVLYAMVFGAYPSTGVLLPMLVIGDVLAIHFYGQKANWSQIRRLLPPTLVGIFIGWRWMDAVDESSFRWVVGSIILSLSILQAIRLARPNWFATVPHHRLFAIVLGFLAGLTTMLANAAGPVVGLYLLAVMLPKWELIGTSAWLFLVLNVTKLPLSYQLDLIDSSTLLIDVVFAPAILVGILGGRWLVTRVSQGVFNAILLCFTIIASIKLMI